MPRSPLPGRRLVVFPSFFFFFLFLGFPSAKGISVPAFCPLSLFKLPFFKCPAWPASSFICFVSHVHFFSFFELLFSVCRPKVVHSFVPLALRSLMFSEQSSPLFVLWAAFRQPFFDLCFLSVLSSCRCPDTNGRSSSGRFSHFLNIFPWVLVLGLLYTGATSNQSLAFVTPLVWDSRPHFLFPSGYFGGFFLSLPAMADFFFGSCRHFWPPDGKNWGRNPFFFCTGGHPISRLCRVPTFFC